MTIVTKPRKRPTLRDIANEAGVSTAAVSYALNGKGSLTEQTRRRILDVARALNYPIVSHANQWILGVLYPEGDKEYESRQNRVQNAHSRMVAGVRRAASRFVGCDVHYAPNHLDSFFMKHIFTPKATGLIFVGVEADHPSVQWAVAERVPTVILERRGAPGVSSVGVANRTGMREMTEHLIKVHGLHRFHFVHPVSVSSVSQERLMGCQEAIAAHGLPQDALTVHRYHESAAEVLDDLLTTARDRSETAGIVVDRFSAAKALIEAAIPRGGAIPSEFPLVGFGHEELPGDWGISPTTVRYDSSRLSEKAVELVHAMLTGEIAEIQLQLGYETVIGTSCGCRTSTRVARGAFHRK